MNEFSEPDIHDERELNKLGLETYFLDNTNVFDISIDRLIDDLKKHILVSQEYYKDVKDLASGETKPDLELNDQIANYDATIQHQQFELFRDIVFSEEQLLSLVEMKVIYAYKSLEISIKKLLAAAFSLESAKEFFKWENLIKFLKSKNIEVKSIDAFTEIAQLRIVNNAIKHSDDYQSSLRDISEFKTSTDISYKKLDDFYGRIKNCPAVFLQALNSAVYKELYNFDDSKIEQIAKSFVLRMGKSDAEKLVASIARYYI